MTRAAHTTAGTRNAPSPHALLARALTSEAVRRPITGDSFARACGMQIVEEHREGHVDDGAIRIRDANIEGT